MTEKTPLEKLIAEHSLLQQAWEAQQEERARLYRENEQLRSLAIYSSDEGTSYYYRDLAAELQADAKSDDKFIDVLLNNQDTAKAKVARVIEYLDSVWEQGEDIGAEGCNVSKARALLKEALAALRGCGDE